MFKLFTDRARRVVVLAQEEARVLNHNYVSTEHILLGLIHEEEGIAARCLVEMEISLEAVRSSVIEIIGKASQPQTVHAPFTPRAKKVLDLAYRESLSLLHDYIGTNHILLGLLREGEGVAAVVLTELLGQDRNLGFVRNKVLLYLATHGSGPEIESKLVPINDQEIDAELADEIEPSEAGVVESVMLDREKLLELLQSIDAEIDFAEHLGEMVRESSKRLYEMQGILRTALTVEQ